MFHSRNLGAMLALCAMLACGLDSARAAAAVDVEQFIKREQFRDVKLSPGGTYLAATLPLEDRTGMVLLRLSDRQITAQVSLGRNTDIA